MFKKKADSVIPAGYPQGFGIEWTSKSSFRLGGYDFDVPTSLEQFVGSKEIVHKDRLYLGKTPALITRYIDLLTDRRPDKILDLGVHLGGSAAFLQLMVKPSRLLALELVPERVEILDKFVEKEGIQDSFRVEYGVDQANSALVRELTAEHFGPGRCIDLVIDDASHLLAPTRSSFETIFPKLRKGGSYIIEDFANAHYASTTLLKRALEGDKRAKKMLAPTLNNALQADQKPLHLMAVEAMLVAMNYSGLIQRVVVDQNWLRIIRGHKDFSDENSFDLRAMADDQFSILESAPSKSVSALLS